VTDNIFFGWCWKTFPLSDELMMPGDSFRPLSDELMMPGDSFRSRTKALLGLVSFKKKNPPLCLAGLDAKIFAKQHCSVFHCYLANIVQSWSN
jgi:hypothetical protein